jgi:heme-degrading monooxygenase HmoA
MITMPMRLPWSTGPAKSIEGPHAAMASTFTLRRYRDVVPFLRASMRLRKEAARTPGNVGLGLATNPLTKRFWTLSSWESDDALRAFVAGELHREVVTRFKGASASSRFVFWEIAAPASPPTWSDAEAKLADAAHPPT